MGSESRGRDLSSCINESMRPAFPIAAHLPVLPNPVSPRRLPTGSDYIDLSAQRCPAAVLSLKVIRPRPGLGSPPRWQVTAGRGTRPFFLLPGGAGLGGKTARPVTKKSSLFTHEGLPWWNSKGHSGKRAISCEVSLER